MAFMNVAMFYNSGVPFACLNGMLFFTKTICELQKQTFKSHDDSKATFLLTTKTALNNNWGMYVYVKCKRNYCFTLQNVTLCHFVQHSVLI